jgi:hypothetical protein
MSAIDSEPVVGWRLWKMREDQLWSWAVENVWQPGENTAVCLADRVYRCAEAPGMGCRCGFWALNSPVAAIRLASVRPAAGAVIGLVTTFGTVAVHGHEGFRAEMATVTCLFTDEITSAPFERLWRRLRRKLHRPGDDASNDPAPSRTRSLQTVATRYAVPLVSLQSAISLGLLSELGVQQDAIVELKEWLKPSRFKGRPGRADLA